MITVTMWFIWKSRCELIFNNSRCTSSSLKHRILTYCNENKIHINNNASIDQVARRLIDINEASCNNNRWIPLPIGKLKINVDAYILPDHFTAGIALIIRDFSGRMVEAWTLVERSRDVAQAEAVAVLKALQWIAQLQLQNVIVEGDNKEVMESISGTQITTRWIDANVIRDCQHLLKCLGNVQVCFRNRKCNQVTDLLARYARNNNCARKWSSELPLCVESRLESEKGVM
ncbi:uncharacterized protein LOC113279895 [Papaver somniferum]|uniref:uncharacterized protein LOC113279895 n=1 Tax=Papaver somniferum TaxID=3469 RepID=UPI000E6FA5CF|nr:uncharacterized protein LOC113279895 [Papaver somniferum]